MFTLPRLTVRRQRRVASDIDKAVDDKAFVKSLHADVRPVFERAVEAGRRLDAGRELPPLLLDKTTDGVFGAFQHVAENIYEGMDDRVVPLTPDRIKKKAAANAILTRALPSGLGYLSQSMSLQYEDMRGIVDHLHDDAECVAAVGELHLGYFVDHMNAHLAPYGRAVKTADGRDLEAESDAFHALFTDLAVKVTANYAADAPVRNALLGAYETELEAQRAEEREARRRRRQPKKPE